MFYILISIGCPLWCIACVADAKVSTATNITKELPATAIVCDNGETSPGMPIHVFNIEST